MFGSRTCFIIFLLLARLGLLEARCEGCDKSNENDWWNDKKEETDWSCSVKQGAMIAAGAAAAVAATPVILGAVGFTGAGIAVNSIAAFVQSMIGGSVISGGLFSTLQSAGAGGLGVVGKGVVGTIGGLLTDKYVTEKCDKKK